jgi:hypothetical protein
MSTILYQARKQNSVLTQVTVSHTWEHPSQDMDVIAFDITRLLVQNPVIEWPSVPYEMLATKQLLEEKDIKIGYEILVIGYPIA